MKTAEEILNKEYYKELHKGYSFDIGNYNRELIVEAMKEYAIEVAKEALMLASENAEFIAEHQFYEETIKDRVDNVGSHLVFIDKQSILSETNIPKLD